MLFSLRASYPASLFVPKTVLRRTVTLNFPGGNGTFVLAFNNAGSGTFTWTGGTSGNILYYAWVQDPYRGRFLPLWLQNFGCIMQLNLDYDTSTAGTFKGTAFFDYLYPSTAGSIPVSGTFTSTP